MLSTICLTVVACQLVDGLRTASVSEVMPGTRDIVHTVWPNGPSYSDKLGGGWPSFTQENNAISQSTRCTLLNDSWSGFTGDGNRYCMTAKDDLNRNPELLIYSGNVGILLDLDATTGRTLTNRNLIPRLGSTSLLPENYTTSTVYDTLSYINTSIMMERTCSTSTNETYVLGARGNRQRPQIGLVRHGSTMTQVTISALDWVTSDTFGSLGPCANFVATRQPVRQNCNRDYGQNGWSCLDSNYPSCEGFIEGQQWGTCFTTCSAPPEPQVWLEVSVWGDSVSVVLEWDGTPSIPADCTSSVSISLSGEDNFQDILQSKSILGPGSIPIFWQAQNNTLTADSNDIEISNPLTVTTTTSGVGILSRAFAGDIIVEVPSSTPRCGYNMECANIPMIPIDITISNTDPSDEHTLRLSFSRNFNTKSSGFSSGRTPGAEITGISAQIWETASQQASGIPSQISKNWHVGSSVAYWAGYDGYWWTVNAFIRVPPDSSINLTLALNYETYGGVPAFSHAQLSIEGYSNRWLWEEASLGAGGENICFDPLGSHTQATITDIRPKLFDGRWKENIGGGNFLPNLFTKVEGGSGALEYIKELDGQIYTSGPCLSNASYSGRTRDDSLKARVEISGARTDDFVRLFFRTRLDFTEDVDVARLTIFQIGSETYNYNANYDYIMTGASGVNSTNVSRSCSGGTSRSFSNMYNSYDGNWVRTPVSGFAPWWFAFGPNLTPMSEDSDMLVGDRGIIVRQYQSRIAGVLHSRPYFSILCDKIEFGLPSGVDRLLQGDFIEMEIELLVLPREEDFNTSMFNSGSNSLAAVQSLSNWQIVREDAMRGNIDVIPLDSRTSVESLYPVRICSQIPTRADAEGIIFTIIGRPLGFTPIVVCGLGTHSVASTGQHGLWFRESGESVWTLLRQGANEGLNDFWQTNFDRSSRTYEIVYNVELSSSNTTFAFGINPDLWETESPTTSEPTLAPTNLPTFSTPTATPTTSIPTLSPTISIPTISPTVSLPTMGPSFKPSTQPSYFPTLRPTLATSSSDTLFNSTLSSNGSTTNTSTILAACVGSVCLIFAVIIISVMYYRRRRKACKQPSDKNFSETTTNPTFTTVVQPRVGEPRISRKSGNLRLSEDMGFQANESSNPTGPQIADEATHNHFYPKVSLSHKVDDIA